MTDVLIRISYFFKITFFLFMLEGYLFNLALILSYFLYEVLYLGVFFILFIVNWANLLLVFLYNIHAISAFFLSNMNFSF